MESDVMKTHENRGSTRCLVKFTSVVLSLMLFVGLFSISFTVEAVTDETHIVTFHVNNTALNGNGVFTTKKTNSNGQ